MVLNFRSNLFLLKYLPRSYRKNKSLANLNRFTVYGLKRIFLDICHCVMITRRCLIELNYAFSYDY